MDLDPLKVDSNFFKDSSSVVSSKSLSYVQITKRLDKTVLTVDYEPRSSKRVTIGDIGKVLMTEMDIKSEEVLGISKYFFGQDGGYVKIKMAKPIDVKTRFGSNHGKAHDEFVAITIRGCDDSEKIRLLNVNELATTNEIQIKLQSLGLSVKNVLHERCAVDVPLFANKTNGNMLAWVKRSNNSEQLNDITIHGVSVPVIWCERRKRGCFKCGKLGHNKIMCKEQLVEDTEVNSNNPHREAMPILNSQEKSSLTLTDSDNTCLSKLEQTVVSDMETVKIGMDVIGTSTEMEIKDSVEMERPTTSDDIEQDLVPLASLDDQNEFPRLNALNQAKFLDRTVRKPKRTTSISPGHRANKKKTSSRMSPSQSIDV